MSMTTKAILVAACLLLAFGYGTFFIAAIDPPLPSMLLGTRVSALIEQRGLSLGFVISMGGLVLFQYARRRRCLERPLRDDGRAPVIYLRSFGDDQVTAKIRRDTFFRFFSYTTEEEE